MNKIDGPNRFLGYSFLRSDESSAGSKISNCILVPFIHATALDALDNFSSCETYGITALIFKFTFCVLSEIISGLSHFVLRQKEENVFIDVTARIVALIITIRFVESIELPVMMDGGDEDDIYYIPLPQPGDWYINSQWASIFLRHCTYTKELGTIL